MICVEWFAGGGRGSPRIGEGILDFSYMMEFLRAIQPARGPGFGRAKTQKPARGHHAERARSTQTRADRLVLTM
jgi:hypothetical protein